MKPIRAAAKNIKAEHNVSIRVIDFKSGQVDMFIDDMIWKDVKGFEELYQVSSDGKVKRLGRWFTFTRLGKDCRRWCTEKIMKSQVSSSGYETIVLVKNGNCYYPLVHRLVAMAFIPEIQGKNQVNHKDGNKLNNYVDNLEWVDASENQLHAWKIGLIPESRRDEIRQHFRKINTGVKFTEEHKKKISESLKRYTRTPEHSKHIGESLRNRNKVLKEGR